MGSSQWERGSSGSLTGGHTETMLLRKLHSPLPWEEVGNGELPPQSGGQGGCSSLSFLFFRMAEAWLIHWRAWLQLRGTLKGWRKG